MEEEKSNPITELISYLEKLEIEKTESIKASNYDYTDQIEQKIAETKKALASERKKQLLLQHNVELESLDMAYKNELDEFNSTWEEKYKNQEEKAKQMEVSIGEKHSKETEELYSYLEQKLPKNVKYSKSYYDMKSQEDNLVKLGLFKEASKIKKKIDEIEKLDAEKFNKTKYEKVKSESVRATSKQMNEKTTLKKKMDIELEALHKERQNKLEKLLLKYKNRKTELENQQKQEIVYLENEKLLKKKTTTNKLKNKKILTITPSNYYGTNRSESKVSMVKPMDKGIPLFDNSNYKIGKSDDKNYNSDEEENHGNLKNIEENQADAN